LNAIILGCRLIQSGRAQRAIVGGVDSLAKYTVNGFNALSILSKQPCRSFDADRDGLNLGEAGAYLVLESEELALKKQYCRIRGYGNSCDAYHASALSDEATGVKTAIQLALIKADIDASQIDFIHTHGTATQNNDLVESRGMKEIFKEKLPPFISTKTYTGHTLGAAGAVGAIYTALALANQEIYPSLYFTKPTEENLVPNTRYQSMPLHYALTSAFGFGGNCSSLILEHV
jgi:3-oxoacyl-(acyl-carrier-protein) synthase